MDIASSTQTVRNMLVPTFTSSLESRALMMVINCSVLIAERVLASCGLEEASILATMAVVRLPFSSSIRTCVRSTPDINDAIDMFETHNVEGCRAEVKEIKETVD